MICRDRTPSLYIDHALYLYFLGLSTRGVAKALSFLNIVKRGRVAIWKWIQKHSPQKISSKRKNISNLIVDETVIKVGSELIWLWVAIGPKNMEILALNIFKERNMFVAERFLFGLINICLSHPLVSTDDGTWYPQ
jgi:putative transposase